MKIAVEGCAHGELEKIYESIAHLEEVGKVKVDLLICCGDFQSTRNLEDLRSMAVPPKYQSMCTFYKYYSGEKTAPILTIFIGGNHEASNYLSELAYGGWVAPNIYYLGYAGVIQVAGLRIAGLSGIYKGNDFMKGHFEISPFSEQTKRSVYHVRNLEVFRLKQVSQPVDIAISHDWPRGIYHHGNVKQLIQNKPFFEEEISTNSLGSKPAEDLLNHLKPSYWFSAHLHCKFAALVPHISDDDDDDDDDDDKPNQVTRFLALDKCLPKRKFLQIVDVPHDETKPIELEYDLEWLSILRLTNHLLSVKSTCTYMPGPGCDERWIFTPTKEEKDLVFEKLLGNLKIPLNFSPTVTPYDPNIRESGGWKSQAKAQLNPQTMVFCERLGIDDPIALLLQCPRNTPSHEVAATCGARELKGERGSFQDNHVPDNPNEDCDEKGTPPRPSLSGMKLPSPSVPTSRLSGLVLPPPCSMHDEPQEPSEENPFVECKRPSNEAVEVDTPFENASASSGPEPKKFKRRNQALYTATDDD